MRNFLFGIIASVALATLATAPVLAAERLSLSTWGSPTHYQVAEFVPKFGKLLEEKSDCDIRLRTFEGGGMVKQQFVATAFPRGTIDISVATPLWDKSMEWT